MTGKRLPFGRVVALAALVAAGLAAGLFLKPSGAVALEDAELASRFEYLSENGNSNCSREFMESIASMPSVSLLQGSCCSPMDLHRYTEQANGLTKYRDIAMIPDDPYNIPVRIAQTVMPHYDLELTAEEQLAYDYAMENSDEQGPCCCGCWRWRMYGGLAKFLIREHGFTGEQITEIWDLSDGCGGAGDHLHG